MYIQTCVLLNKGNTRLKQCCLFLPCSSYCFIVFISYMIKDARSVSLYPYNQLQFLQNVKYTKYINIAKGFAQYCDR